MIGVLVVILLVALGIVALLFDAASLVILACLAIPLLLWLVRRPAHMAGMCVSLHAWPLIALGGAAAITPFKLSIVILMAITVTKVYREGPTSIPWMLVGSLLFILAIKLISDLSAPYGAHFSSLYEFLGTLSLLIMLTQLIRTVDDLRAMTAVMLFNLIGLGLYVIYAAPSDITSSHLVRVGGLTGNANALAIAILGPLPLAFAMIFDHGLKRLVRWTAVVAVILGSYALLASASRGGAGGAVLAFIVLGVVMGRTVSSRLLMAAIVIAILPTAWYLSPAAMTYRLSSTFAEDDAAQVGPQVGMSERDEHLSMAMDMIPESPWIGHGTTGFVMRRTMLGLSGTYAHSSILGVTVAYGVPVGIVYLFLVVGSIYLTWSTHRHFSGSGHVILAGLLASIVGIVSASMMFSGQFRPRLWAFVALGWILHHRLVMAPRPTQTPPTPAPARPVTPVARPALQLHRRP